MASATGRFGCEPHQMFPVFTVAHNHISGPRDLSNDPGHCSNDRPYSLRRAEPRNRQHDRSAFRERGIDAP